MENKEIYNPEYVRTLFNRMSNSYERMNYITSFGFSIIWRRQFIEFLPNSTTEVSIIDLLTGMGETWAATFRKFPKAKLKALDFSEGMLKSASDNNQKHFDNKVELVQQDFLENQLNSEEFDIVTCAFGLKTFNENQLRAIAKQTHRILKPNGYVSFIEVSVPQNPILKSLYGFYLGRVIPILGKIFLGNPAEYRMLWKYSSNFKNCKKTMKIFENEGFNLQFVSYFGGCATGFYGNKLGAK